MTRRVIRPIRTKPTNDECYGGFDLSLTATGIHIVTATGEVKASHIIKTGDLRGPQRLDYINNEIRSIIAPFNLKHVCLEGYSMGGGPGRIADLGELGGLIRVLLYRKNIPFHAVAPTSLKKFATGAGKGEKDQITMHVYINWQFKARDNNEADACALAHVSRGIHGFGKLSKPQQEVIKVVTEPKVKKKKKKKDED